MSYFREFPNLQYVNRFPDAKSNDEVTVAKNIFKRPKIREDLASVFSVFEYYTIGDEERPDIIAEKIYGNPEYDWIILMANNILDPYEQWPLSQAQLNEYLFNKYGSESVLQEIHHYETLELKDSYGRVVLPGGLVVDSDFYNAPKYQTITETPPGITLPPIYLEGIVAIATAQLGGTIDTQRKVVSVNLGPDGNGRGYFTTPTVIFSGPTTTLNASAGCGISNYQVTSIVGLNTGKGYRNPPTITITPPPVSVQASAESVLGVDFQSDKVVSITITNTGIGYGLTAPSVSFSLPPTLLNGGAYREQSSISIGNQVDGIFVRSDGAKVFVTSGIGTYLIRSFDLTEPWRVETLTALNQLNVSSKFSYCSGIDLSPDGTKMFISGGLSGAFLIARYDLSTAWDLSTATFASQITVTAPGGVRLKSDGTKLYILNANSPDSIEEYTLPTPWNISSKVFVTSHNIEVPTGDNQILGFSFNADGTKMFVGGVGSSTLFEFDLDPWDLTTLTLVANLYVGDRISNPSDVFISEDSDHILISGGTNDKLIEYQNFIRTKGVAVVENSSLKEINITSVGIGYTLPPTITIGSPYPAVGAAVTAILSGTGGYIQNIVITNPGFGYTVTPTLTIDEAPTYSTAIGIASISNGKVISIRIVDEGQNYDSPPSVTFYPNPEPTLNVEEGDTYSQANKIWRWNGTVWQERITEPYQFLDDGIIKSASGNSIAVPVSVYEYEQRLNEEKRFIIIPKKEYISTIIRDLKDMMKYDQDSDDVIDSRMKSTYNPKFTGV